MHLCVPTIVRLWPIPVRQLPVVPSLWPLTLFHDWYRESLGRKHSTCDFLVLQCQIVICQRSFVLWPRLQHI